MPGAGDPRSQGHDLTRGLIARSPRSAHVHVNADPMATDLEERGRPHAVARSASVDVRDREVLPRRYLEPAPRNIAPAGGVVLPQAEAVGRVLVQQAAGNHRDL